MAGQAPHAFAQCKPGRRNWGRMDGWREGGQGNLKGARTPAQNTLCSLLDAEAFLPAFPIYPSRPLPISFHFISFFHFHLWTIEQEPIWEWQSRNTLARKPACPLACLPSKCPTPPTAPGGLPLPWQACVSQRHEVMLILSFLHATLEEKQPVSVGPRARGWTGQRGEQEHLWL